MAQDRIDEIMEQRRLAEKPVAETTQPEGEKFFLVVTGELIQELFLELQFASGVKACFSYTDLSWFNLDPESGCLDVAFGGFLVTIKGRGLDDLYTGLKYKRVAWVREAASEMQDHKGNASFIEEIEILPPNDFVEEAPSELAEAA